MVSTQFDDDGQEYVITYALRSNNDVGSTNLSQGGEALGVVWLVAPFSHKFEWITNGFGDG